MKTKAFTFLGVSALLLAAGACSSDKSKQEQTDTIEFETYSFSENFKTDSTDLDLPGAAYWHVAGQGVLPVKIGSADISALRDSLANMSNVKFASSGVASPREEAGWKLVDKNDTTQACNEQYNYLSIVLSTPWIIVWQDYSGVYNCGAAHGMYSNSYVNYSLRTNKILNIKDLMQKGYEPKLTAMLREKLDKNPAVSAEPNEIQIPSQWRVTSEGITFVYGVYEIGPYAAGEIEVPFALYELENLLTPEAMKLLSAID